MLRVVVFENNLVILSRIARKMKKIKGTIIKHLGFEPIKQGDFIYHEGPLLSHFVDKNNPSDPNLNISKSIDSRCPMCKAIAVPPTK